MPYYPPATGGGTPGGANTQVQFNDSGAFGGDAGLTYDKSVLQLTVGTAANTNGIIKGADGTSANPNGADLLFTPGEAFQNGSPNRAGNIFFTPIDGTDGGDGSGYDCRAGNSDTGNGGDISFKAGGTGGTGGAGGVSFELGIDANGMPGELSFLNVPTVDPQDPGAGVFNDNGVLTFSGSPGAFLTSALQRYITWYPTTGSAQPSMIGASAATLTGNWTTVGATSTSATTRQTRSQGATAASAGATIVYSTTGGRIFTGTSVMGSWTEILSCIHVNTTGHQCFFGLSSSVTALTGDPSALVDSIGVGFNAADLSSGNWQFYNNDGSGTATKTDTGIPRAIDAALHIQLMNVPGTTDWNVTLTDINTPANTYSATFNTNTPTSGIALAPVHLLRTGVLTTACSMQLIGGFCKWISS